MNTTTTIPLTSPDLLLLETTEYRIYDTALGMFLIICTLIGTPANISALTFFRRKRNTTALSTKLYIAVCVIDSCTCIVHLPVTAALLNGRSGGLFEEKIFCVAWYTTFLYLQRLSMFLVVLITVTRTIMIAFPFFRIHKKTFMFSFIGYSTLLLIKSSLPLMFQMWYGYDRITSYCYYSGKFDGIGQNIYSILHTATVSVPGALVFTSVIVATCTLRGERTEANSARKHRASVTIVIFTATFLVCNLPCFLNHMVLTVVRWDSTYQGSLYYNKFMFFYSWVISEIHTSALNALLNPILYFIRMADLREWFFNTLIVQKLFFKL